MVHTQFFKVRANRVESFSFPEDWEPTMMTVVNPEDFIECLLGAWQCYKYLEFVLLNPCSTPVKTLLPSQCVD